MRVLVITPPDPDEDLDAVKLHLSVDDDDHDPLIEGLMAAASVVLDGPGGWLGRAIGMQALELRMSCFDEHRHDCRRHHHHHQQICLPCPPLVSVESIKYLDTLGVEQTLDPSLYQVTSDAVLPAFGKVWPTIRPDPESVKIRFTAGYETRPAPIGQARLLLIGHWFANREAVVGVEGRDSSTPLPIGVDALLSTYRVWP